MKVLICWHAAVEPSYRRLLDEISERGAEVRLIAPREWSEGGRLQKSSRDADKYGKLILRAAFTDHVRAFFYPNALRVLSEIKSFDPDIIHIMEEPFSLAAYEIMSLKRLARSRARTILFSFENIDVRQRFPYSFFQTSNLKEADAIIVVPEESAGIWKGRGFKNKIVKIPLGIDSGLYRRLGGRSEPGGVFKLGYSGRLVEEKGLQTVLKAMSALHEKGRQVDFYIAGSGAYGETLDKTAREEGLSERLHFLGSIGQDRLPAFYGSLDALVLPSLTTPGWKEQFGRVLAEAMACGTPVIGSSSGEIPNVIGRAGLVFREADAFELASCIERLISDPELRAELTERGYKAASKEYTWGAVAQKYIELYRKLT